VEEWRGCFNTAANPDPDSESDSYDPMWECFNVEDRAVASDDDTTDDDGNVVTVALAVGGYTRTPE